ncbi:gluconate 5-dehydrogenase [Singulisphaera sp. GP187]|uniref:SDR family oxidoreductase n=1 Tax=Singulisphaera sp. GP187 TaxID=1882752 RepID=UPI0009283149|nr:SDR family oxidoreductase [Singulisphaera sp. GP187]SIO41058.1 gluconate 5-dehydrogenase [Singulisphaera sp. GP187]
MPQAAGESRPTHEPTIPELFDLTGKVVLITGGTGHLGSAMARALAEAGASVVITSRDAPRAEAAAAALPRRGETATHHGLALDHMKPDELDDAFSRVVDRAGRVDILVNNGHEALGNDLTSVTAEQFTRHLAHATGYFILARLVRDYAVERAGPASIILLGSMYGLVGSYPDAYEGICSASPVAYHTLKGGIVQMTRHLAAYWAADGVRVNCLSPGPFPPERAPAAMVERLRAKLPMKRMGQAHELKGAVVFLASDASSFMTGQNLVIDGGWTAW